MSWLLDLVPWWIWALAMIGGAAAAYPVLGPVWRLLPQPARLGLAAIVAAGLAYLAGRKAGAGDALAQAKEKEAADAERIVERAARARAGADTRAAGGGLRDDDGWRRGD